jgi:hypothetical protein
MNLYIAKTTNNEQWEIQGGIYIVEAESKENAKLVMSKCIFGEELTSIQELTLLFHSDFQEVQEGKVITLQISGSM